MADKPDLILLDIIMPGMNGFEVLSALKEMDDTRSIPVIIITGLDTVVDEEKGFRLGAVDYITKPFNKSLVKARVVTHLRIVEQVRIIEQFGLLDPLTNIPNRRSLNTQMALEWRRAIGEKTPVSFGMVDLDHFKMVNDTYGHQQGDTVLKSVAGILKSSMKRPSDFAARWGGEEFAVLLPETDSNGALKLAEDIRGNIEKALIPGIADTSTISVTASIGIASTVPTVESSMSALIERADQALYAAKKAGRNRVCLL
jgi:diguanylate cyclase (GGDEF)-like protein